MITFSQLGKYGRLGNQMFQYAALYGTAFIRGYKVGIPENSELEDVFELKSAKKIDRPPEYIFQEPGFEFSPNVWMCQDKTDLVGYFQSPGYWQHCIDKVFEEFKFKPELEAKANSWVNSNLDEEVFCSIHVRRGDYVKLADTHTNLPIQWYQQAVNIIEQNIPNVSKKFFIFSDDPEWCEKKFMGANIVSGHSGPEDLCIMSKAKIHITANSSFSWWAATLSKSSAVIAPKQWFGPAGPKNWESLYMNHWLKL
tara:strand:- start:1424 stop:2185 length:762 start_codon:yes stop_codon:yes gene_type:complete